MAGWRTLLEEVIRERRGALVGYASLYAPDRAAAEDLVQEALVRVFSRTRDLRSSASAEHYVRQAIRTAFLDQARKDRTWRGKQHLFADDDAARGPEQAVQAGVDVRAALATLAPRERACVVLRFFDDMTVPAVAAELGLGEGTVKRYLSDATATLRDVLGVDIPVDDPAETTTVTQLNERRAR